jgi:anthranilate synthase component 1
MASKTAPALNVSLDEAVDLLLSRRGNCLPLFAEIPADLLTPVLVYLRLTDGCRSSAKGSFLLESVVQGAFQGRFSFIGVGASARAKVRRERGLA